MPVTARRFRDADTHPVHNLIIRNFLEVNVKDYGLAAMQQLAAIYTEEKVRALAKSAHMYVFETDETIVGTGSIARYWGSPSESILLRIFVLPAYHGKGIGSLILQTLEQDELFTHAKRIEIPASITAVDFYRKYGYTYKNGVKELTKKGTIAWKNSGDRLPPSAGPLSLSFRNRLPPFLRGRFPSFW